MGGEKWHEGLTSSGLRGTELIYFTFVLLSVP